MTLRHIYVTYRDQNRRLRSPSTDRVYRIAINQFAAAIGHEPTIADLTDANLILLEKHLLGRSPYTINERVGRIKAIWRFAAKTGLVGTWPTLSRLDTHDPVKSTWTVEQVRQLIAATARIRGAKYCGVPRSNWWESLLRSLWDTGERIGAMRACQWDWLDGRVLAIPAACRKGNKPAAYVLSSPTLASLDRIRLPARADVWPFMLTDCSFYLHFRALLKLAGLPSGRKDKSQRFRRTHLTLWEVAGYSATARAQHSSRAVTERFYLDVSRLPQLDPTNILPSLE